jgi:hypothetical protein
VALHAFTTPSPGHGHPEAALRITREVDLWPVLKHQRFAHLGIAVERDKERPLELLHQSVQLGGARVQALSCTHAWRCAPRSSSGT